MIKSPTEVQADISVKGGGFRPSLFDKAIEIMPRGQSSGLIFYVSPRNYAKMIPKIDEKNNTPAWLKDQWHQKTGSFMVYKQIPVVIDHDLDDNKMLLISSTNYLLRVSGFMDKGKV